MPKLKTLLLRFSANTDVSPKTLRLLREKFIRIKEWCEWVGILDVMLEMDVEIDDEAKK